MSANAWQYIKRVANPHSSNLNAWFFPHPGLWIALFVFAVVHPLWLASSSVQINYQDTWMTTLFGGWLLFLGVRYQEKFSVVGALAFTGAYLLLIGQVLRSMTYLGTAAGYPLIDGYLSAFDKALGFDWQAHVAWVNSTPWAVTLLHEVYMSILSAMMVVLGLLFVMRRFDRIRELLLINGSLGLLGIVFCTFLPAIGAYAYYAPASELVSNIPASAGRYHLEHFNGLRSGDLLSFDYVRTQGIITFPSFHTIVPVLLLWSLRGTWAFWPTLPVCVIMIVSTISIGGHHLADIIASIALCAISIWLYAQYVARPAFPAAPKTPAMATDG
ncbi:MAG: phosphatase PAP2 family protein [Pseudomonadota bacterium]